MRLALLIHALLMLLASTSFTIVTFVIGGDQLNCCYFKYAFENGFGYDYQPAFSFPVVAAYVLAFGCGLFGFALAYRQRRYAIGLTGMALSLFGLMSFVLEASHWVFEHNLSWLAFSPAAMLILAAIAVVPWGAASLETELPKQSTAV